MAAAPAGRQDSEGLGVMERQRKFMGKYGEQLEQACSILVYLIPVKDEDGDGLAGVWTQATYSVVDLFSLYRTVLLRRPADVPVALSARLQFGTRLHTEIGKRLGLETEPLAVLRRRYTMSAFLLRSVQALAIIVEMRARQVSGARQALLNCFSVEAVKLFFKLVLWSIMPFAFYVDDSSLEAAEPSHPSPSSPDAGSGNPSGHDSRALVRRSPSMLGLVSKRTGVSPLTVAAEILFHGRPFLQLAAMLRAGEKAWSAWMVAFVAEITAYVLLHAAVKQRPGPQTRAMKLEEAELARRRSLLPWAFARSPFFDAFLERRAVALDKLMRRVPALNVLNVMEIFLAFRPFYFYTSGT